MWRKLKRLDVGGEPFRVLFPLGVLAGVAGAMLWPAYFWGILPAYPGQAHARLMAHGLFGSFIFGFLGTALPRMLSSPPLRRSQTGALAMVQLAAIASYVLGWTWRGDCLFLAALAGFTALLAGRFAQRKDLPPPGFSMVALALVCAGSGALLSVVAGFSEEPAAEGVILQRLLSYQGFVLLPILGVGGFLLPRFFGLPERQDFPTSVSPPPGWTSKAWFAFGIGLVIVASFFVEVFGGQRAGHAVRLAAVLAYVVAEIPVFQRAQRINALGWSIRTAFVLLLAGFVCEVIFPGPRVGWLHLTLVGGFAVITFSVATRVVYGHSGNGPLLQKPNRWLYVVVALMLLGMVTRISGDFWPKIMPTHYTYGALMWVAGVVLWSWRVLPKVLQADPGERQETPVQEFKLPPLPRSKK